MLQHRHAKKLERKIFNFFEQVSFSLREVILGRNVSQVLLYGALSKC